MKVEWRESEMGCERGGRHGGGGGEGAARRGHGGSCLSVCSACSGECSRISSG